MGSNTAPGWVGSQGILSNQMVLCVQVRLLAGLPGWTRLSELAVLCDQVEIQTVPQCWAGLQDGLNDQVGLWFCSTFGKVAGWAFWL